MQDAKQTYLVIGPPRSASTAFARVLWNNPGIRYYAHEPYESTYYHQLDPAHALDSLARPFNLAEIAGAKTADGLLVKEMTFQAAAHFDQLLSHTDHRVVFLIRDPRLTISSRRDVKQAQQQPVDFPLVETGWQDLVEQVRRCRDLGVPYLVVDSSEVRADPEPYFRQVCAAWHLDFDPAQLSWNPLPGMPLSNRHAGGVDHFYVRVLNSSRMEPPLEQPVAVSISRRRTACASTSPGRCSV